MRIADLSMATELNLWQDFRLNNVTALNCSFKTSQIHE